MDPHYKVIVHIRNQAIVVHSPSVLYHLILNFLINFQPSNPIFLEYTRESNNTTIYCNMSYQLHRLETTFINIIIL